MRFDTQRIILRKSITELFEQLYGGLPEDDTLCGETRWSSKLIGVTWLKELCIKGLV